MPIQLKNQYVELNRRFRILDSKADSERAAKESYTTEMFGRHTALSWDELLKERRAVILGEPGSGKSFEFRERAKLLGDAGHFALFVRLDQLISQKLHQILDENERRQFARWKESQSTAYFFLDSVDEAKFARESDFHLALKRFQIDLTSRLAFRASIFLSSRVSEWKPLTDGFEFEQLFRLPATERQSGRENPKKIEKPKTGFLAVQLEPLNREQVEIFASARNLPALKDFIQSIDDAFAWEFARRPLDVADLIAFWSRERRLGTLTELIEWDICSKLRPNQTRSEFALSEALCHEGVEWLSAGTLFSRRFTFGVPDHNDAITDSLNPRDFLPGDWSDDQLRALLNRPMFDGAVYGHFRFHHRRVAEYLAAQWIAGRMEGGCPPEDLSQVLAESVRTRTIIRPSLRPIAAWLCIGDSSWNRMVRKLVAETEPGIHLLFGDPAALSLQYRRDVLAALAKMSRHRQNMWISSESDSLARLASSSLSDDIARHISDSSCALDFRVALVEMVQHGRLIGCADALISVVASPTESERIKSHIALANQGLLASANSAPQYD